MVPTQLGQFHAATHVDSIVLGARVPNGCRSPYLECVRMRFGWVRMGLGEFGWAWVGSGIFSHKAKPQRRQAN